MTEVLLHGIAEGAEVGSSLDRVHSLFGVWGNEELRSSAKVKPPDFRVLEVANRDGDSSLEGVARNHVGMGEILKRLVTCKTYMKPT